MRRSRILFVAAVAACSVLASSAVRAQIDTRTLHDSIAPVPYKPQHGGGPDDDLGTLPKSPPPFGANDEASGGSGSSMTGELGGAGAGSSGSTGQHPTRSEEDDPGPNPTQTIGAGTDCTNNDEVRVDNHIGSSGAIFVAPGDASGDPNAATQVEAFMGAEGSVEGLDRNDTVHMHDGANMDVTSENGGQIDMRDTHGASVTVTNPQSSHHNVYVYHDGGWTTVPPGSTNVRIDT